MLAILPDILNLPRVTSYDPGPTVDEVPLVVRKVTLGARPYIVLPLATLLQTNSQINETSFVQKPARFWP